MPLPERQLISRVRRLSTHIRTTRTSRKISIVAGVGDDCSVLRVPAGHDTLVTTDFSLEGVHFRRDWHPPESVGYRCLVRGLSDVAAMGGEPIAAFLSLALPENLPQKWVDGFFRGFLRLAQSFRVPLAGGDTSQSTSGLLADIVVVGTVPKGKAILRSGARPGDLIYVTGKLGGSAATLDLLTSGSARRLKPNLFPAHFSPSPRLKVARMLREKQIATAMIDISDGLSTDLSHICDESATGADLWQEALPRARIGKPQQLVDIEFALHGGEDYELLFTARPETRVPSTMAGVRLTRIGEITRKGLYLVNASGTRTKLEPRGWEHFARASIHMA